MKTITRVFLATVLSGAFISGAGAMMVSFDAYGTNGDTGQSLGAMATFDVVGTDLIVTLQNIGGEGAAPSDVLTAVFFDLSGGPSLGASSAVLGSGSGVYFGTTDPGGVVGGEWAYKAGIAGPGGAAYGIGSAGFGVFGPADRFPGSNLQGPDDPDGIQYGLVSASDDPLSGNAAVTGSNALIHDSVVFTLSGIPSGFDPSLSVGNVSFQYGTAFDEPNLPSNPIPEPASVALLGLALAGWGCVVWRRSRSAFGRS